MKMRVVRRMLQPIQRQLQEIRDRRMLRTRSAGKGGGGVSKFVTGP